MADENIAKTSDKPAETATISEEKSAESIEQSVQVASPIVEKEEVVDDSTDTEDLDPNSKYGKFVHGVTVLGKFLKIPLNAIFKCTGFFILVYIVAWTLNAIYSDIHFDLASIRDFYLMIVGKNLGEHSINSFLNSDRGQMPTNRGK